MLKQTLPQPKAKKTPSENLSLSFIVKTWSFTKIRLHLTLKLKIDTSTDFFTAICRRRMKFDEKQALSERKAKSRLHHRLGSFTVIYIKGLALYWKRTLVAWSKGHTLSQNISLLFIGQPWKRSVPRCFDVKYMWYDYRDL